MRKDNSLQLQIQNLLLEARQAEDPGSNGLLDRTDCLDLISRLAAAVQNMLGAEGMLHDRDEPAMRMSRLTYPGSLTAGGAFASDPDRRRVNGSSSNMGN
jgi:hypothetical protein